MRHGRRLVGVDRPDGALCNVAGARVTAMGRRSRGFVRRGGLAMWCTAARCCRRRCRHRRRGYGLHPALLDAALHVLGLVDGGSRARRRFGAAAVRVVGGDAGCERGAGAAGACVGGAQWRWRSAWRMLQLADGNGRAVARVGGLRLREASEAQIREASRSEAQHLYRLEWRPVALSEAGPEALPLMVGGDGAAGGRLGLDQVESVSAVGGAA